MNKIMKDNDKIYGGWNLRINENNIGKDTI